MDIKNQILKPQSVGITLQEKEIIDVKNRRFKHLESLFHFHEDNIYEMVWVEKSSGKRFIGDHIGDFTENDIVLMAPQLPHKWINDNIYYEDNELYAQTTVTHFSGDLLLNLLKDSEDGQAFRQLMAKAERGICLNGESQQKAILLMQKLNESKGLTRTIHFLQIIEIFCHTVEYKLLASTSYKTPTDDKGSKRLNDVYEYVVKNFKKHITLEEIAKIACMSPTAFCRFFKQYRNSTFVDFLNEIRIAHACKLLRENNDPIMDVCLNSGFNNMVNFNKFFKKTKKCTPLQYKNNLQELRNK